MLTTVFLKHMINMSSRNSAKRSSDKKRKVMKKKLKKYVKPGLKNNKVKINFAMAIIE